MGQDVVLEALKRSVEAQKNYNYAKGILKNWKINDINTIKDIEKQDKEYALRKKRLSTNRRSSRKETISEWTTEDYIPLCDEKEIEDKELSEKLLRLRKMREEERIL